MGSVVAPEKPLCYEEFSTEYSEIKLKLASKCQNFDKAIWWYKVLASAVKSLAKCCDRGDLTSILPEERTVSILSPTAEAENYGSVDPKNHAKPDGYDEHHVTIVPIPQLTQAPAKRQVG
jgi:hypothetical protein